ncbi:MAG: hypothetical protein EB075_12025 [Bacteroidetes bacterium]|nr:hypothetical protein [Bacteroidota bacterium]
MGTKTSRIAASKDASKFSLFERQLSSYSRLSDDYHRTVGTVHERKDYRCLVLSASAGLTSLALAGTLRELEHMDYLTNVAHVCATGYAALLALQVALGTNTLDIESSVVHDGACAAVLPDTLTEILPAESELYLVAVGHGGVSGNRLMRYVDFLLAPVANKYVTMQELYQRTQIHLVLYAYNATSGKLQFFDHRTTPTVPVRVAVRAALGVPGDVCPIVLNGETLLSGEVLDPCPVYVFDGETVDDPCARMGLVPPNPHTLALVAALPEAQPVPERMHATVHTLHSQTTRKLVNALQLARVTQPEHHFRTLGVTVTHALTAESTGRDVERALHAAASRGTWVTGKRFTN